MKFKKLLTLIVDNNVDKHVNQLPTAFLSLAQDGYVYILFIFIYVLLIT